MMAKLHMVLIIGLLVAPFSYPVEKLNKHLDTDI